MTKRKLGKKKIFKLGKKRVMRIYKRAIEKKAVKILKKKGYKNACHGICARRMRKISIKVKEQKKKFVKKIHVLKI